MPDKPYHSGAVKMGRNLEQTDEWTLRNQAYVVTEAAKKESPRDRMLEKKIITPKP